MSQSYEVVTDALTGHARTLRELAGELERAADTAGGVALTSDAYGQTGQPFVTAMAALARAGQDALRTGVASLESAGSSMIDTVTAYGRQETGGITRFTALGAELTTPEARS
jgi:hypothetical protein